MGIQGTWVNAREEELRPIREEGNEGADTRHSEALQGIKRHVSFIIVTKVDDEPRCPLRRSGGPTETRRLTFLIKTRVDRDR